MELVPSGIQPVPSLRICEQRRKKPKSALGLIVLNFIPSWFTVNMGTGIISILLVTCPHQFPGLHTIGTAFYLLNIVLFVVFALATVARYFLFPWVFGRMLRFPAICMFLGSMPMGLATIITATVLIAVPLFGAWVVTVVACLWWADVALTVLSAFAVPMLMFHVHDLSLDKMTAVWLLPIVPTVVVAAAGGTMAPVLAPGHAMVVIVLSYMLWGVGMGLSLFIMAMYFHRLAIHNLPNGEVIVSAFLPLGPLGQGSYVIIQLARAFGQIPDKTLFAGTEHAGGILMVMAVIMALVMWGLGAWWLVHGVLSVLVRQFAANLQFNMGFWGFIFPLGVYTAATIALAEELPSVFLSWLAVVLIIILVLLWLFVAGATLRYAINRKLFVAPCLTQGPSEDACCQVSNSSNGGSV